jgi:hypothetical protein
LSTIPVQKSSHNSTFCPIPQGQRKLYINRCNPISSIINGERSLASLVRKFAKFSRAMQSFETLQNYNALISLRCVLATLTLAIEFMICRLLYAVPLFHVVVEQKITQKAQLKMVKENYWDSLFGWQMFKECWKMKVLDLRKQVSEGMDVVDSPLITADGQRQCVRLLDVVRIGRPLVLNFGSSS